MTWLSVLQGKTLLPLFRIILVKFAALNLKPKNITNQDRIGRSYRNFNHDEFDKKLIKIDWELLFRDKNCDDKILIFLNKINRLLDEMAPIKKLTKKEMDLKQNPWLTIGILKSIHARDVIHKMFLNAKDPLRRQNLFREFKIKRNLITTLIRSSKSQYYKDFFAEHSNNAKKTWEGIRNIIKVSTKNHSLPTKIRDGLNFITNQKSMAQKFNEFYVNIGNMVEEKIPKTNSKFSDFLKAPFQTQFSSLQLTIKTFLPCFPKLIRVSRVSQTVFLLNYSKCMLKRFLAQSKI